MNSPRKERGIIMSAPMVKAILEGRKTQTRRVVKPQPTGRIQHHIIHGDAETPILGEKFIDVASEKGIRSPYGKRGDRLWVRETWAPCRCKARNCTGHLYAEKGETPNEGDKWRSPLFMPREACRIVLEIGGVRVERLQSICEADCKEEGCAGLLGPNPDFPDEYDPSPREQYKALWDSINAKPRLGKGKSPSYSWNDNPWVWVVEFKRVQDEGRANEQTA